MKVPVALVHEKILEQTQYGWKLSLQGMSLQNRPLYRMETGEGPTKIMLWTQMHGDESTATRALFLLWDRMKVDKNWSKKLRQKLSICCMPLVNPDGAHQWTRENAAGIDINRDARALRSPEAVALARCIRDFAPHIALNLHDQQIYYGVGKPAQQAGISLMAPPADRQDGWPENRRKAARICVNLHQMLREKSVVCGKWQDEFEPRAFGEFAQQEGAATVLIEAGAFFNDPEKINLSRLYAEILASVLDQATRPIRPMQKLKPYRDIPKNELIIFDLLLRKVSIRVDGKNCITDLGIRRRKIWQKGTWVHKGTIEEIGDLEHCSGLDEYELPGYELRPGKLKETEAIPTGAQLLKWANEGFTAFCIKNDGDLPEKHEIPLRIVKEHEVYSPQLSTNSMADLVVWKEEKVHALILNGLYHENLSHE